MSRFRMYPTPAQQSALLRQCGHARYVWNLALEQWSMWTRDKGPTPRYVAQARQLTEARATFGWLRAGSQTVQQQALRDFDRAVKSFYAGIHRRPTWRRAGLHEGFRIVGAQASRIVKRSRKWAAVNVPKVGWVRFLSSGELLSCPGLSDREQVQLKHLQRRLARCPHGSNRRRRVKAAIAKLYARAGDRRKDWVEKTSTDLARRFDVIRVEDLRIAPMTRCPKPRPDPEQPGRYLANRRRAKAGLNRGILANGWGQLVARLEHNSTGRAVSARRETPVRVSSKREPQLATST